jgi:hypothetical protein
MDEDLLRMVQKHHEDLYEGRGKANPSLCERIALAEKEMENMKEAADEIRADSKKIKFMVIAAILAIIGDIVSKLLVH